MENINENGYQILDLYIADIYIKIEKEPMKVSENIEGGLVLWHTLFLTSV